MSPLDALYNTVHDFDGGAEALAPRLGKNPGTLRHEVRPPVGSTAKAGLLDAVKIMEITRDLRALDAIEAHFGRVAIPLQIGEAADGQTFDLVAKMSREFADVMTEISGSIADGVVSDNELKLINAQALELIAAVTKLTAHCASLNAAGKPKGRA